MSMVYKTTPQLQASALNPSYPCDIDVDIDIDGGIEGEGGRERGRSAESRAEKGNSRQIKVE